MRLFDISRRDVRGGLAAIAATLFVLLVANEVVEWLERRGRTDSYRPGADDMIQFVDQPLFEKRGDRFVTTRYAERSMVRSSFAVEKGRRFRVFVLGESFAMGTPYAVQAPGRDEPGGIPFFLAQHLAALAPGRPIEVVNAAAGAQDSNRVRAIAKEVLAHEPDVLVVATGNNEGALPPGRVAAALRKLGGVRLLLKLLAPQVDRAARPRFTPQDADTARIRDAFGANVRAILDAAARQNVKVLLCTMPVNLRYEGGATGPLVQGAPEAPIEPPGACLRAALALVEAGRADEAERALRGCADVEAVRALGLLEYRAGRFAAARETLAQYVELMPRNRTRPSFNQLLRDEAARFPDQVRLVDLEARAEAVAPHGVPGPELFFDYCHMNWRGYAQMTDEVLAVMERAGWLPGREGARPSLEALRERFHLSDARPDNP